MKSSLDWIDALIPHLTDEELVRLRDSVETAISKRSDIPPKISKPEIRQLVDFTRRLHRQVAPSAARSVATSRPANKDCTSQGGEKRMPWPAGYSPRNISL
jgi:hypothetical protein